MDEESPKEGETNSQEAFSGKQPSSPEHTDIDPRQNHQQTRRENYNRSLWFVGITAIATAVIALTNICFSVNAVREMKAQAEASQRAAKVAEDTLHLTQAADLQPGDPPIRCTTAGRGPLSLQSKLQFVIRNTGRTRAEMTDFEVRLGIPGSQEPTKSEPGTTRATIGAGVPYPSVPILVRDTINARLLERINNGELEYHLKGYVKYLDIFGRPHAFQWDSVYAPNTPCSFTIRCTSSGNECE